MVLRATSLNIYPQTHNHRMPTDDHNLVTLQQLLINTELGDDAAFRDNFRSLAATVFFLEDCFCEEIEDYNHPNG